MSDLSFVFDLSSIDNLRDKVERFDAEVNAAAARLSAQAHAHIVEQVQEKLHTTRTKYLQNLKAPKQIEDGVFQIKLDAPAMWIEEGLEPHSMIRDLLRKSPFGDAKSEPKQSKDGATYRVIPFEHNKTPSMSTPAERTLTGALKSALKELKIPYSKIERSETGDLKTGMLHKVDMSTPDRPGSATPSLGRGGSINNKGFGRGHILQPMQGPTGIPFMQGLRIYQTPLFNKDGSPQLNSKGKQAGKRSALTFRVVSSKMLGEDRWNHPGLEPKHFFEDALKWTEDQWKKEILPDLIKNLGAED
jgi:hypothetical protein